MFLSATTAIHGAPNAVAITPSATVATTHDVRVSTDGSDEASEMVLRVPVPARRAPAGTVRIAAGGLGGPENFGRAGMPIGNAARELKCGVVLLRVAGGRQDCSHTGVMECRAMRPDLVDRSERA
jgi:hypothetical protein